MPRRILATSARALGLAALVACAPVASPAPAGAPAPPPGAPGRAPADPLVGVWGTSTESYLAASVGTDALRLSSDGTLEHGAIEGGRFVATPARASASAPARYALEPSSPASPSGVIRFALDGADEEARYQIDGPDRFRTTSGPPDPVTVYYARRRER